MLIVVILLPLIEQLKACCLRNHQSSIERLRKMDGSILELMVVITFIEKEGKTYPVSFHGTKKMSEGLRKKIVKERGLH